MSNVEQLIHNLENLLQTNIQNDVVLIDYPLRQRPSFFTVFKHVFLKTLKENLKTFLTLFVIITLANILFENINSEDISIYNKPMSAYLLNQTPAISTFPLYPIIFENNLIKSGIYHVKTNYGYGYLLVKDKLMNLNINSPKFRRKLNKKEKIFIKFQIISNIEFDNHPNDIILQSLLIPAKY